MAALHYRTLIDYFPTKNKLIQRNITVDPVCVLCYQYVEDINHIYFFNVNLVHISGNNVESNYYIQLPKLKR